MFFFIKRFCIILCALSIAISSHAYIYQIDIWHKRDSNGKIIELYCMSDIHLNSGVSRKQKAALLTQCKQLDNDTLFIVEDSMSETDITHPKIKAFMSFIKKKQIPPQASLLCFLADELREQNQKVINVENRQIRFGALLFRSYLLGYEKSRPSSSAVYLYAPTIKDLIDEFEQALSNIRAFCVTDGPILAQYYSDALTRLNKEALPTNLLDRLNTSEYFHNFVHKNALSTRRLIVDCLPKWGSEALDINALHHIHHASNYSKICVIMGGIHVQGISSILPAIGYTKVKTIGTSPLIEDEWHDFMTFAAENYYNELAVLLNNKSANNKASYTRDELKRFIDLAEKIVYTKPISTTDFNVIADKKSKRPKKGLFSFLRKKR